MTSRKLVMSLYNCIFKNAECTSYQRIAGDYEMQEHRVMEFN